jgi:hypothetical protein
MLTGNAAAGLNIIVFPFWWGSAHYLPLHILTISGW